MMYHGINIERFAKILAKRWKRDRTRKAFELSELKSLTGYSEGLYPETKREVCAEIERRSLEIFEQQQSTN